ncbi:hypothetical protein AVEN_30182-1 [Araneus ventricosus]|uniref:Uncharacterized protein n=1 Tax=Araneus ventricosus TaxID=182803 RepID=A0A4Y2DPN7_ARAVE|nr:hypothetical protein AVEN_30182-1 [Araneus ventricosus]
MICNALILWERFDRISASYKHVGTSRWRMISEVGRNLVSLPDCRLPSSVPAGKDRLSAASDTKVSSTSAYQYQLVPDTAKPDINPNLDSLPDCLISSVPTGRDRLSAVSGTKVSGTSVYQYQLVPETAKPGINPTLDSLPDCLISSVPTGRDRLSAV